MLEVESVDWHLLENAKDHHTDRYEIVHEESTPVLRRSQPFNITITFKNRPFDEIKDSVRLFFLYEKKKLTPRLQSVIENTTITSSNRITDSQELWSLQLMAIKGNSVTVTVRSPPTAAWGVWTLSVKTSLKALPKTNVWKSPKEFYLLYNPWAEDDCVYMPETRYLDEYVLNDVGKVYTTSSRRPIGMKWIFGQFATPVIKVMRKLIAEMELEEEDLGSPNQLCYNLARNVGKLIMGNWSGDFSGGTKPWLWTGSIPIFEEFLKTWESVRFGQCFIYSAVYTTALRAVGFPARSVTNFISASGGDRSMALNHVFNSKGEVEDSPSIWNFHVWNDAWMSRPDLPSGYGGWQATDGTNALGPAPIEGIKKGQICYNYEVENFLAEVNADRVRWTKDDNGEYHLVNVDTKHIGRSMLTKEPFIYDPHGDTDFQDVMSIYKEKEGTKEERLNLYNAIKQCKVYFGEEIKEDYMPPFHVDMPDEDDAQVTFELEDPDTVLFGQSVNVTVKIENKGDKAASVEACLGASSEYYNGASAGLIKRETKSLTVKPNSKGSLTVAISPVEYAAKLVEFSLIKLHCIASVKEDNFTWADDWQVTVDMPEIFITTKKDLMLNKEGIILFKFKNPLKSKLTKCNVTFEAPGIGRNVKIQSKDIKPEEEVCIEHKVKPIKSGEIQIKAIFNSKEMNFLGGSAVLQVD